MSNYSELYNKVISRANKDSNFRTQLLSDPRSALKEELGFSIPDGIKINVVEEKKDQYYLVLPSQQHHEAELSDAELDSVSGGYGGDGGDEPRFTSGGGSCLRG